jgi:hypothetical protein
MQKQAVILNLSRSLFDLKECFFAMGFKHERDCHSRAKNWDRTG